MTDNLVEIRDVYYNGHLRLRDVTAEPITLSQSASAGEGVESLLGRAVNYYLTQALAGGLPVPGQPQKLVVRRLSLQVGRADLGSRLVAASNLDLGD
jgi:hypothetical protein